VSWLRQIPPNCWCAVDTASPEMNRRNRLCIQLHRRFLFAGGGGAVDKFPLLWERKHVGELTVERESLYTWFTAEASLEKEKLWCAWVVGEQGELRLGVLEPAGNRIVIRRRFSNRMTAPMGRLLRGEIRPVSADCAGWEPISEPQRLFGSPWLTQRMKGIRGVMVRRTKGKICLAIPYQREAPFPLTTLFCFAKVRPIGGTDYVVFCFDREERPVMVQDHEKD